jgi:glutamine synthetase
MMIKHVFETMDIFTINSSFQWEFQVGPSPGIQAADHVIFARYILLRLAEMHNVKISFRNIDCARGTNARQTFHLNFSTKKSREEGGLQ